VATENGISLTNAELTALNRWVARLLREERGPSNRPSETGDYWYANDVRKTLAGISVELARAFCKLDFGNSSARWRYLGKHHPELIVACIKAGAFKEIGDEDADNRDD